MLTEYKGPANSSQMLEYLVGETILGCMADGPKIVLVLSSGVGLVFTSLGGETSPVYYKESREDLKARLDRRLEQVRQGQAQIAAITHLTSLLPD